MTKAVRKYPSCGCCGMAIYPQKHRDTSMVSPYTGSLTHTECVEVERSWDSAMVVYLHYPLDDLITWIRQEKERRGYTD